MKSTAILSLFAIVLLAGCSTPQPEDNNDLGRITPPRLLEDRIYDFRVLIQPQWKIDYLVKNHMCLIKIGGFKSSDREIPIGNGLSLNEVIQLYHGKPYDGQVKVVSRNTIIQTSIATYNPKEQDEIKVLPGDLVFIDARD